jgi:hypothetical protein
MVCSVSVCVISDLDVYFDTTLSLQQHLQNTEVTCFVSGTSPHQIWLDGTGDNGKHGFWILQFGTCWHAVNHT